MRSTLRRCAYVALFALAPGPVIFTSGCKRAHTETSKAAPVPSSASSARATPVASARLAPSDGGTFVTVVKAAASSQADAGTPAVPIALTLDVAALAKDKSPATTFTVHPVRQQALRRLPDAFDAEGKLLAVCSDAACDVWERATGAYRGARPKAELSGFRTSADSLSSTSPNGKYALKAWGAKGGVAIVRVEGGAVLARAERAGQSCATAGAWKGEEPRVAVPCGSRMVALEGAPAKATWSAPMPENGSLVLEGVWSDRIYGTSHGYPNGESEERSPYEGNSPFTWDLTPDGGEVEPHNPSVDSTTRAFDPVGGCVFEQHEVCGCDCNESLTVYGCDDAHGADAFGHKAEAEGLESGSRELLRSADGLTYGWLVETSTHRGYEAYRLEATRIGKRAVETFTADRIAGYGSPRVVLLAAKGAFALVWDNETVRLEIHRFGKDVVTAELERASFGPSGVDAVLASPGDERIVIRGAEGGVEIDADDGSVTDAWEGPMDAGGRMDAAGERADASACDAAAANAPAPKYRVTGLRGLERASDGARMTVNDDRVYVQGAEAFEAWHDLDEATHFLLGDDVLRSPLVSREQIDPQLVVKGAFAKFLKGEPLPPSRVAQLPLPPLLRVVRGEGDPKPVTVRVDGEGTPASYFEIDHAGRIEKIPAAAAASTVVQTIAAGEATRVRACGAICSPWVTP